MMQPVMDKLEENFPNDVEVLFYDVWTEEENHYAQEYGIRVIPTQVFLDENGEEYFRHEGFFPYEQVVEVLEAERGEKLMLELFTRLTMMLEVSIFLAMVAAFLWGILSVVLSPCHLAGIPLIMGHIVTQSDGTKKKAGIMALLFALGILVTLLIIGIVTSLLGRLAGDAGPP